jgi:hypothetical protein
MNKKIKDIRILDEKKVVSSFKKWLLSTLFLPYDIDRNIKVNIKLHILPLGDIFFEFENRWHGEIGILQENSYQSEYDKVKEYNAKNSDQKKLPDKKDYIIWSYGQDTFKDKFTLSNRSLFSFENISNGKSEIMQFISIYSKSFFDNFNSDPLSDKITEEEISMDEIQKLYSGNCRNYAIRATKYPGDDQRNIKNEILITNFSIKKKYLPVYTLDYQHKGKKFSYCCDAVTAWYFTGIKPHGNYFDEIIIGVIGILSLSIYSLSGLLPTEEWSYSLSIQKSTFDIFFLVLGILSIGYVILSVIYEANKASIRKSEIDYYENL